MLLFSALGMVSCSEDEGEVEEYVNWQATNDAFFSELSGRVKTIIADNPGQGEWLRIKSWSKASDIESADTDYIIVKVVESAPASETVSPAYTDTAAVHYHGNLLPSLSYHLATEPYPLGFRFDSSYEAEYDPDTSVPVHFAVGDASGTSPVVGFSTALQHMRRGDHWIVYIPYQLGYGVQGYNVIPAYSTLVFEIRLADFWD